MKQFVLSAGLCLTLAACGSLATKSAQLHFGDTKRQVHAVMGDSNYSKADGDLEIWQYATIAGFGYCDYRRVWFWKGKVTAVSSYHHASIAGCSAGLKHIDWPAAMAEAPITANSLTEASVTAEVEAPATFKGHESRPAGATTLADQLAELDGLHKSGALTDAEYEQAKRKLLDHP